MIPFPYSKIRNKIFKYRSKIHNPLTNRKITVYFVSKIDRKEAKKYEQRHKNRIKKLKKFIRKWYR